MVERRLQVFLFLSATSRVSQRKEDTGKDCYAHGRNTVYRKYCEMQVNRGYLQQDKKSRRTQERPKTDQVDKPRSGDLVEIEQNKLERVHRTGNNYVHNDCFLCLLFLNYNVWPPEVDFMVCLDCKVPQQFYSLILLYAFGRMFIPFVTTLNSIFLAHLPMYDPPNTIMPLFIFCLYKFGATTQKYAAQFHLDHHTFCIWMVHFCFRFWLLWRSFLILRSKNKRVQTPLKS